MYKRDEGTKFVGLIREKFYIKNLGFILYNFNLQKRKAQRKKKAFCLVFLKHNHF